MGRGSTQEPPWRPIETYGFCTVVAIWIYFGHLRIVQLHQNCLQSKGVESILLAFGTVHMQAAWTPAG